MNALLIYPEFPETYWSFKHALKFLGKRAAQPPLGLMTVAALLPKLWKKRLVDTNVDRLQDQRSGLGRRGTDKRHAYTTRVARGHRRALPRSRAADRSRR